MFWHTMVMNDNKYETELEDDLSTTQLMSDLWESSREEDHEDIAELCTDILVSLGYYVIGGEMDLRDQALKDTDLVIPEDAIDKIVEEEDFDPDEEEYLNAA